ncbi:MAG: CoA transferase [Eubacteriales bacterium]|nr:CoA transferase [Eubacteriales bacterium]
MNRPLEGIRVLDLTQAYSGPFCTMQLADMGAEVIKIEAPIGDQTRGWGPIKNNYSGYYAYVNRNKKGMVLNLKTEEGKQILRELIAKADIICENFKVGTFAKLGFPYEELKRINPRIIYGSISGFGITGPFSSRPAYDIIAQAMSGMIDVTGFPDQPGVKIGPSIGDNYSGAYLCLGILMALYQREKTGEGCRLDVAMVDTLFSVMENFVVAYTIGGEIPKRNGNVDPAIAPFATFHAKDGDFAMGCGTDKMWGILCGIMNTPQYIEDPRFKYNDDRCKNFKALEEIVNSWSTQHTVAEIDGILEEAGIPVGPINNIKQIAESEQIAARNMLWKVYDPGIKEEVRLPGCPIKIQGVEDNIQKAAPLLGEDTDAIMKDVLGYSDDQIKKMHDANACG